MFSAIPPMVNHAKQVAVTPSDRGNASNWRNSNDHLLNSVRSVGDAIAGLPSVNQHHHAPPPQHHAQPFQRRDYEDHHSAHAATPNHYQSAHSLVESVAAKAPSPPVVHHRMLIREEIPAPPRPPPPVEISPPPRPPPPPEVDEEEETRAFWERYPLPQASSQPILSAAHSLHQVRKFKSFFGCLQSNTF